MTVMEAFTIKRSIEHLTLVRSRRNPQHSPMTSTYILTLSCPDRTGIVHAVSGFLLEHGGNIEEAAQYNDHDTGLFFMRVQFACARADGPTLATQWGRICPDFWHEMEPSRHRRAYAHRDHGQQRRPLPE